MVGRAGALCLTSGAAMATRVVLFVSSYPFNRCPKSVTLAKGLAALACGQSVAHTLLCDFLLRFTGVVAALLLPRHEKHDLVAVHAAFLARKFLERSEV